MKGGGGCDVHFFHETAKFTKLNQQMDMKRAEMLNVFTLFCFFEFSLYTSMEDI